MVFLHTQRYNQLSYFLTWKLQKTKGNFTSVNILFSHQPSNLELSDKLQESLERVRSFRKAGKHDSYE